MHLSAVGGEYTSTVGGVVHLCSSTRNTPKELGAVCMAYYASLYIQTRLREGDAEAGRSRGEEEWR